MKRPIEELPTVAEFLQCVYVLRVFIACSRCVCFALVACVLKDYVKWLSGLDKTPRERQETT